MRTAFDLNKSVNFIKRLQLKLAASYDGTVFKYGERIKNVLKREELGRKRGISHLRRISPRL